MFRRAQSTQAMGGGRTAWVAGLGLVLAAACSGTGSGDAGGAGGVGGAGGEPLFQERSGTYLPATLTGFSMDARAFDVEDDGDLDILVAIEFGANRLLLNDGEAHFTDVSAGQLPATARDSEDIGIADFDLDGDLDVIIVSEDDQVNELYLNDGLGNFTDASDNIPVTGTSNAVVVADFDDDFCDDVLIGNDGQNALLLGDCDGGFTNATATALPEIDDVTQALAVGDVDDDGDLDVVVGNEDDNYVLINDGTGVFSQASLPLPATAEETRDVELGDVDDDGDLDIVFGNVQLFVPGANPRNRLLLNDGTGTFTEAPAGQLPADSDSTMDVSLVDLDNDFDLDIITANFDDLAGTQASAPYRVYENDGLGNFTLATGTYFPPGVVGNGMHVLPADFNDDGVIDLYLVSRGGTDRLLLGR